MTGGFPDDPVSLITDEVREQYRRDGVVFLKKALHPDWLELLEMGLNRVLADSSIYKFTYYADRADRFDETIRNFDAVGEIQTLIYHSPIADMLGALIQSENVWYYSDEFFLKEGASGPTPWHQDISVFPFEGEQVASMWISLDPLSKSECLETIPGSHLGTRYDSFDPMLVSKDPTAPNFKKDYPRLPDVEAARDRWNIQSFDLEPGDVILLHPGVLHGGAPTGPDTRRRAITIRLYGDDIVFAERPGRFAPYLPGLRQMIKPGEPLRSPWFPQVRPLPDERSWR